MQTALITLNRATLSVGGVTMIFAVAALGGRPSWGSRKHPR